MQVLRLIPLPFLQPAALLPAALFLVAVSSASPMHAQGALPAAQPTTAQRTPAPAAGTQASTQTSTQSPAHRAPARHTQVLYAAGLLTIHAENSSLNGILREISRSTGMAVTGGVADERVYGSYGPADTGTVLAALLAGTGSNMLLEESTADRPLTLVLTPRQGGPTPPSPVSVVPDEEEDRDHADLPPQQTRPTPLPGQIPVSAQNGNLPAPDSALAPASVPAQSTAPADTATTNPAGNTTDQQSPNGVKTPQQIYDQLMKLRQPPTAPPQP